MDSDDTARLIYLGLMLAAVAGWGIVEFRSRMGQAARMALAWGLIVVALMSGYGLWEGLSRDHARQDQANVDGRIEVPRGGDGHFYLTVLVNGAPVDFMVDTGAFGILLSPQAARDIGLDPAALVYDGVSQTANGTGSFARIRLETTELEGIRHVGLPAAVNSAEMSESLLGMDYLRLFRMEVTGDLLILTPQNQ
jgi:aspartyl protease family protein